MKSTRSLTRTALTLAAVAMALVVLTSTANGAIITASPTAPPVNDADIAMLNQTGSSYDWGSSVTWADRPWRGQTFTTGSNPAGYTLDAITVQSSGTTATLPHDTTYALRVGSVSGTSFTQVAPETGSYSGNFNAGDYVTFMLNTPISLPPSSVYGFDLDLPTSNRGWNGSAWMLNRNAQTEYPDGSGYDVSDTTPSTISPQNLDRIFHLNMTADAAPPPTGTIIKPVSVTGNIVGDAGSHVNYLLDDNPGFAEATLQRPLGTAVPLNTGDPVADALATFHAYGGGAHAESWTNVIGAGNPEFVFDLGADTGVDSIILWQYGNNGGGVGRAGNATRDFRVVLHTEAEGNTFNFGAETADLSDTMDVILGTSTVDNYAQFFNFGADQTARYVGLRVDNNYLGQPGIVAGGDRYGLGEVRLALGGDPPIPQGRVFVTSMGGALQGAAYAIETPSGDLYTGPTGWTLERAATLVGPRTLISQGGLAHGDAVTSLPFPSLPADLDEGFESGDIALSPWTQVVTGSNQEFAIVNSFGTGPQAGAFQMGQSNWGARDNAPDLIQARSAEFVLGAGDLSFYMQGGAAGGNILPTGLVTLDPNATGFGYLAAVLRDATTDDFLLTDSKSNGNDHAWELGGWSAAELLDHVGKLVTIDLIDNYAGSWGFIAFDSFTLPQQTGPIFADDSYYFLTVDGVEVFAGQAALIPEPGTMCLLGLGLLAVRRRRR